MVVSVKVAKLARDKGCDLPTLILGDDFNGVDVLITQSELQKWLREKRNIHIEISLFNNARFKCTLLNFEAGVEMNEIYCELLLEILFETYESALETGLLEALKLIK